MRQETMVTLYFTKQELQDALELYVGSTHPALLGHFSNVCDFSFVEHPNTGEIAEIAVTFSPVRSIPATQQDETRIFQKLKS